MAGFGKLASAYLFVTRRQGIINVEEPAVIPITDIRQIDEGMALLLTNIVRNVFVSCSCTCTLNMARGRRSCVKLETARLYFSLGRLFDI